MPELPEVETMRRGILACVGSRIAAVEATPCERKPIAIRPTIDRFARRVVGRTIVAVERVGKRVVVRLDDQSAIVFEPRMTGLVLVADPPTVEHLRFRMSLDGGRLRDVWYWDRRGLGSVRLFSGAEFDAAYCAGTLGPDALTLSADALRSRYRSSRRAIKVALLDQKAVGGIGNLYASEILFHAGVHPARRCDLLSVAQWERIHAAMLQVLHAAIASEGSTLSDGTYRNALNDPGGYQKHHQVYARGGEPCRRCGATSVVRRIVQAQRATFFCPGCQRNR